MSVAVMSLGAGHWYTLPGPEQGGEPLRAALAELRKDANTPWAALHVLYADCRCSQRVFDHLLARGPMANVHETVLLVGTDDDFSSGARSRGFAVREVSPETLRAEFGLVAAPLLAVADAQGALRYAGGYTERKQGLAIEDERIIRSVQDRRATSTLPLFGCAVAKALQDVLDPLGIKYRAGG